MKGRRAAVAYLDALAEYRAIVQAIADEGRTSRRVRALDAARLRLRLAEGALTGTARAEVRRFQHEQAIRRAQVGA